MCISKDWFRGTQEKPFCYEQNDWILVKTTTRNGRSATCPIFDFDYEEASTSSMAHVVGTMRLSWELGKQSFVDEFGDRPKTTEERFEDGIAWAAMVAEANDAPRAVVDAIKTKRPKS